MSEAVKLGFAPLSAPEQGVLVVFTDSSLQFGPQTRAALKAAGGLIERAARSEGFKGRIGTSLDLLHPAALPVSRLLVLGIGDANELKPRDYLRLGGIAAGKLGEKNREATILCEFPRGAVKPDQTADIGLGVWLRNYRFDRYKTKRKDDEERGFRGRVTLATRDVAAARKAWRSREAVGEGTVLARDLVNEPPNVLFPQEFARRAQALKKTGVEVEVLDPKAMRKLGMNALLGVAAGSRHEARLVVMRWNGGRRGAAPVAFIGKGVTFDTGGISIKPAASMEDMKGDMAGAACVVGLMRALALRKARVNAVGLIGLVENMPGGNAQRPGDIVTSMSGQTIEIVNTDAEGRLVLGDVLWYAKQRFKPQFMIDLATLTGAIIIALGHEHAGLFSNNDTLADRLALVGDATGERVWRMPLAPEYDKLIDSKFADMKNTGGRAGGSITAAQFLHRFVDGTPWAHLDIAGTGFASPQTDVNKSWASGWGVRLLNALVAEYYER
ncbi:MAG TPA: leucyl aminopeptidase [Xanthobacteraceae bacterium]|nr:leucyl aminopeptidase [Xanthobacteraceae bacterium]